MERKLRQLFDYQKFENNAALAEIIADTESRMNCELSDEDLSFVAAAGPVSAGGIVPNAAKDERDIGKF